MDRTVHVVGYVIVDPLQYHSNDLMETLSDKVAESQNLMRTYAAEHYLESKKFSKTEAEELSRSCVSQRDIQVIIIL